MIPLPLSLIILLLQKVAPSYNPTDSIRKYAVDRIFLLSPHIGEAVILLKLIYYPKLDDILSDFKVSLYIINAVGAIDCSVETFFQSASMVAKNFLYCSLLFVVNFYPFHSI